MTLSERSESKGLTFREIDGQDGATAFFRHARKTGRLAHAYLFTGPEGVGKGTFARTLAKSLLCAKPGDEPCGTCDSCRQFDHGNNLRFITVTPPTDKKGVQKTIIDVESVRDLGTRLSSKLGVGNTRVVLFDDPIGDDAANALLKMLEEPPAGNVFLIVTQSSGALPPTIHSRCHKIRFRPIADEMVAKRLVERSSVAAADARFLARLAQGSMGKAVAYAEEGWKEMRDKLRDIAAGRARDPENFDMGEALDVLIKEGAEADEPEDAKEGEPDAGVADYRKGLRKSRERARTCIAILALFYRDLVMAREGGAEAADPETAAALGKVLEKVSTERLLERLETLLAADGYLKRNANVRLTIEWALVA
ncbi:MAG: DNA polymerase III subunit delta' [Planctomycetes bacterium]|nr:DNA polymerase III subunit delta' [Planctomycetota bacterium]